MIPKHIVQDHIFKNYSNFKLLKDTMSPYSYYEGIFK